MMQQIIYGTSFLDNPPPRVETPVLTFPGKCMGSDSSGFRMDEALLARHTLLLGGSGCGKTNVFFYALASLRRQMSNEDVLIVFDTKAEFYEKFSRPGDAVIGNNAQFYPISCSWNLFDEVLADGNSDIAISLNAREIAAALFHGRGSATQPFFCQAARNIFRGVLLHFIRAAKADPARWGDKLNNAALTDALHRMQPADYIRIFNFYPDLRGMVSYFGDGTSNQAQGVFGELNSMLSEYFVGILAEHRPRSLSMRQAVRARGGRAVFVEYDLSLGETLTPIYRLLIDQALKEALGQSGSGVGNVYLIADEFKLLPKLQHIDDALNFGRSMGVKVMAGIQSIDQLYDVYGRERGAVIAGGFGSLFAFHTNDSASREYITRRFGPNLTLYEYFSAQKNTMVPNERQGNTVEEWDQLKLGPGQAAVGLGYAPPFLFQFDLFREKGD